MKFGENKLDFIGFGALNLDIFYRLHEGSSVTQIVPNLAPGGERMANEWEREKILESAQKYGNLIGRSGGGQAANTTVALSRMGFRCGFLGKVGDDEMGDLLLESLGDVDKSHIQRGGNSGACLCILDNNSERANAVFPACNDNITLNESDMDYVRKSKILHLTSFCSEDVLALQEWLLEHDLRDTKVTFDPGEIYSRLGFNRLKKILKRTHVLFATSEELALMAGKKAAEDIIQHGTQIVVRKRGGQGSKIVTSDKSIDVPITKVDKVVDKTGAGDVYAAGFIAGLLIDLPLEICGKLASEAAAMSITGYGREKYPDRDFLTRFNRRKDV